MSKRSGLLAGGNWIVDAVKLIDVFPQQDALANIQSVSRGAGGSPFNILVDLAIMGAKFPLRGAGLIGSDENGKWIRELCAKNKIETAGLLTKEDAPTSFTDVMTVKNNGRRTFFHARGANALLGPEHFDFTKETAKHFHYGYLLLLDRMDQPSAMHGVVAAEVLERATKAGMKVSIDCVSEDSDRFPRIVKPAESPPVFPAPPMAHIEVVAPPKPIVMPSGSAGTPANHFAIDPRTGAVLHEIPGGYVDPRTGQVTPR